MNRSLSVLLGIAYAVSLVLIPGAGVPVGMETGVAEAAGIGWEDSTSPTELPTRTVLTGMRVAPVASEPWTGFAIAGMGTTFSGRVVALLPTGGEVSPDPTGVVVIEGPGFSSFPTNPNSDGYFSVRAIPFEPAPGVQYRASYSGSPTSASSVSEPLTAPTALPTVSARAVRANSKLRVNINPNLTKGNWRFVLTRQINVGLFQWVRTYKSKGIKEIRTIDLPAGTYKVYVYPQRDHAGAWSGEVNLLK